MLKPSITTSQQLTQQTHLPHQQPHYHTNLHSTLFESSNSNRENPNNLCTLLFNNSSKMNHHHHSHHHHHQHDTFFTSASNQLLDLEDIMEDEYQALRPCLRTLNNVTLNLPPKKQYLVKTRQKRKPTVIPSNTDATRIVVTNRKM